jgi:hypothetical protein
MVGSGKEVLGCEASHPTHPYYSNGNFERTGTDMEDREIVQKIKSFPRWHYQFDLNGHLTPIYFVWEKQRYETERSVIRSSIASQNMAAARGILPSVSSPWDGSRETPLSIELSSRPILIEG